ncbi:MAG: flagellar basal body protein [Pirellulales bacterium]
MFSALFDSTAIPVMEQVVGFTQSRHAVLAGNVANMDTPGYRVRDLSPDSFQSALRREIEARREGKPNALQTKPGEFPPGTRNAVRESLKGILFHDESNDSLEHQVAEINKNQVQHNLAITVLSSQFHLLQAAITERAG